MKEQGSKTDGVVRLRYMYGQAKKSKNLKYVTVPFSVVEKIMEESENFEIRPYRGTSNSVRAASLSLSMDTKELCERLNSQHPNKLRSDLSEAKTKIKLLEDVGDKIANLLPAGHPLLREWAKAKYL